MQEEATELINRISYTNQQLCFTMASLSASWIHLITKDIPAVKISIPGRKLVCNDRFGNEEGKLHERVKKGKTIMERRLPKGSPEVRDMEFEYSGWKATYWLKVGDAPIEELAHVRQLCLDLGVSDAYLLFPDEIKEGSNPPIFKYPSDQIRAFLAAKEVTGQLLSENMCKFC